MKKRFIIAAAILGTLAVSCNTHEPEDAASFHTEFEEFYATTESAVDPDTKTYTDDQFHVLWHADDRVSIFNKYTYNQEYAFTGETGANAGGFSKAGTDEFITGSEIDNIYAVYPYQKGTMVSADGVLTVNLPAEQVWTEKSFGRGANTMIAATTDSRITFRNAGGILILKFYGSGTKVKSVTLKGNSGEKIAGKATVTMPVGGTPSVAMQSDATQSITLNCATPVTIGTSAGSYTEFWFVVPPTDFAGGFTITVTCADGGTFEKSTEKSVSLARNHIYRMAPIEVVPQKPAAVPEYVDLGLSVKWARANLGATEPEEFGDYFAWGETEPKSEYNWSTYKWCNGSYNTLTKYNTRADYGAIDNKIVLDLNDDAAHVNWGGSWRMPTDAEWTELRTKCTRTWTSQNGVNGRKVTGPNGNSIFLPAAGSRYDSSLGFAGSSGFYWSSSLNTDYLSNAWYVYFHSGYAGRDYYFYRCLGHSVRPVYDDPEEPVSSVSLNRSTLTLTVAESKQLTATVLPSTAINKRVNWSSSNTSVATVDSNGKVTGVKVGSTRITAVSAGDSSKSAYCEVTVMEQPIIAGHQYVDLGLPSCLIWATMNVGATKPEEYGDYFAWGETEPKSEYNWSNYKFDLGTYKKGPFSKYVTNSSYGTVDNNTVLDPEDDVAHEKWGGSWRMPTDAEWTELLTKCTWTLTTQNGVNGSKVTGPNGNSIFLPAAGNRYDTGLDFAGSRGYYWSSSLGTDYPYNAWSVDFISGNGRSITDTRCLGKSVRPVTE